MEPGDAAAEVAGEARSCLLDVLCLLGFVVVVSKISGDIGALNSHLDPMIHLSQMMECWSVGACRALLRVQAWGSGAGLL